MEFRTSLAAAAAAAIALAFTLAGTARACSVCLAGDPQFSQQGASAQQQGDASAFLQVRGWRKTSGLLPGEAEGPPAPGELLEEANRSQRVDLYLSWTPLDRFTFTVNVPWALNHIQEREGDERSTFTHAGIGDVSLFASAVLWRDRDMLPSRWLEARLQLKLPTGQSRRQVAGVRDPHLQVGTGSWDFGVGLAATQKLAWGSLFASVSYRENSAGSLDYEYGDIVLANLSAELPLGHGLGWRRLDAWTASLSLDFRHAGFDHVEGLRFDDSGGAILYATPSLRIRLPLGEGARRPSLTASVEVPLTQAWLHHQQQEKAVWSTGILVPF